MGYYLIDFENVHDIGLNGVTSLSETDEICIFYSAKSEHMSFETHVNIMKTHAKVKYIKLRKSARNYLDFQLVTHLGYLVGSNAPGPYYIISKDTGYDSAIDYWRDHGVNIIRQPSISYNIRQGRFPGQQSGQITPAALVTIQESHQVVSENTSAILEQIPENAGFESRPSSVSKPADQAPEITAPLPEEDIMSAESTEAAVQNPEEAHDEAIETVSDEVQEEMTGSVESVMEEPAAPQEGQQRNASRSGAKGKSRSRSRSSKTARQNIQPSSEDAADLTSAEADETNSEAEKAGNTEDASAAAVSPDTAPASSEAETAEAPASDVSEPQDAQKHKNRQHRQNQKKQQETPAAQPQPSSSLEMTEEEAQAKAASLPEAYRKKVRTALKGKEIPSAHYASIYKAILHSYDKLALNNLMVKTFGSSKGGVVYNQIKDIFTDFHQQRA